MKGVLILFITMFAAEFVYAAEPAPVIMHLELAKDTLALAEPAAITVTIYNESGKDIILDNSSMFTLYATPYAFSLNLLTPDNQIWKFNKYVKMDVCCSIEDLYYFLPAGKSVTDFMMAWWTCFLPPEKQTSLETIKPGKYKLYATYRLPKDRKTILYSDTVEFEFLPPAQSHIKVLEGLDSMSGYFNGEYTTENIEDATRRFERIRQSNTPYSEAAYAQLIMNDAYNYDVFPEEKSNFEKTYPHSVFQRIILERQITASIPNPNQSSKLDSLYEELDKIIPNYYWIQLERRQTRRLTQEEALE